MFYFPNVAYHRRFKMLSWPLPNGLLPWLADQRGLGIYALPRDSDSAKEIVHGRLGVKNKKLEKDGRLTIETAHYWPQRRLIILPHDSLFAAWEENVVLHEIGHAIDHLFLGGSHLLSSLPEVQEALRPEEPLNRYCAAKQHKNNNLVEQFATAFAAYFVEPEKDETRSHVENLSSGFISFLRETVVDPFKKEKYGEK